MASSDFPPEKGSTHDRPAYQPPTTGYMSYIPPSLLSVAQLIRLDKPGFVYFFIPVLCGALQAARLRGTPPADTGAAVLKLLLLSFPVTFINYAWNDTVDADLDRRVRRTRHRPIARGAISTSRAYLINILLAAWWFASLAMFRTELAWLMIPCALGAFVYPLSKRFTAFPQVVFGLVMASGALVGASALGLTPFVRCPSENARMRECAFVPLEPRLRPTIALYAANIAWAVCYEIVYSFQDVIDDEAAGSGTITLLIKERPKPLLWLLATLQTVLFAVTGVESGAGPFYFMFSVILMAVSMVVKLWSVDLQDPESCIWWFSRGALITGGSIAGGLLGDYLQQRTW